MERDRNRLTWLKVLAIAQGVGWAALTAVFIAMIYVSVPGPWRITLASMAVTLVLSSAVIYLARRPAARRLVWPAPIVRSELSA